MTLCIRKVSCSTAFCAVATAIEQYIKMSSLVIFVLHVLPFLCTHCQAQELPYVSFNGETYANHSYLDLTLVGKMDSNIVTCHTSVQTCCSGRQGPYRGDWYFPSGSRLPYPDHDRHAIAQQRAAQRIELTRINNGDVSGIYLCNITVGSDLIGEGVREFVYIGLYTRGGKFILWRAIIIMYFYSL